MPYLDFSRKQLLSWKKCEIMDGVVFLGETRNQGNLQMRLIYL